MHIDTIISYNKTSYHIMLTQYISISTTKPINLAILLLLIHATNLFFSGQI